VSKSGNYLLKLGRRIEKCSSCEFFKKNYYCFYGANGKPKYMMLMQNPGLPKNSKDLKDEIRDLKKEKEITPKIDIWRKYFKKWVKEKNRIFFERFLEA